MDDAIADSEPAQLWNRLVYAGQYRFGEAARPDGDLVEMATDQENPADHDEADGVVRTGRGEDQ